MSLHQIKSFQNSSINTYQSTLSRPESGRLSEAQHLSVFQQFAPIYAATPYWDLEPVPSNESLPGQRYRLVLVHGNLRKAVPLQLHPDEGDRLLAALKFIECDWSFDLDKTGQLCSLESTTALTVLVRALVGGGANV